MLLICFRTCAGCHFSPQPAICLCLLPRPSADHLFLPEPALSNAVSAPLKPKCGRGPVSLLPAVCSRLRNFTKLCWRLQIAERNRKEIQDRTLDLCNSSSNAYISQGFPAKCLSLTHTCTSCTMFHWPVSFSLAWNQDSHTSCVTATHRKVYFPKRKSDVIWKGDNPLRYLCSFFL